MAAGASQRISQQVSLKQKIQTAWFQPNLAVLLWPLLPLSWLFAALAGARRALYRAGWLRPIRLPVPVVVVGNITVGGAGKTPLTLHLAQSLRDAGRRPGIVSRGYGGRVGELTVEVRPDSDPAEVGDEPLLLAQRSGVPVFVGRARSAAGQALLARYPGVDVILCDDGLQHYALARDVEIAVSDQRGLGNRRLLPAGPLREPASRLWRVDAQVFNGGADRPGGFGMTLTPGRWQSLHDPRHEIDTAALTGKTLHAVAGIGDPRRFFATLKTLGLSFTEHPFSDHHAYGAGDFAFAAGGVLLLTEKDAVKCRPFYRGEAWVLPVAAQVSPALTALVLEKIDGRQTA